MKPLFLFLLVVMGYGQTPPTPLTPGVKPFIAVDAPLIALEHVRIIDGTGTEPGRIRAIGGAIPAGAFRIDLIDHTVIPGLIGMHEHLFYPSGRGVPLFNGQGYSFPRLYLASGVTTARTAGTMEPQTDLRIKRMIDQGQMPGPKMLITVGYLEGKGGVAPQMTELSDDDDAANSSTIGPHVAGMDDHIGSVSVGKQADLVVIDGNPATQIADIKKVKLVFKDGVGYDPGPADRIGARPRRLALRRESVHCSRVKYPVAPA